MLTTGYFKNRPVTKIAQDLIGKVVVSYRNGVTVEGVIVETEAYCGKTDRACHAYPNKQTSRTKIFYEEGGILYVYLCYGIHSLVNIITGSKGSPEAVLIRAIYPISNVEQVIDRRNFATALSDGPGKVAQALAIGLEDNGYPLNKRTGIWIEDRGITLQWQSTSRIGVDYAGEDAKLPWRYVVEELLI